MKTTAQSISAAEVTSHIESPGDQYDLIDVRTPVEFQQVHLPDSISMPLESLAPAQAELKFSPDHPLILICRTGNRAKMAAHKFETAGFKNTKILEGWIESWLNESRFVERSATSTISLERQVRIAAGFLVFIGSLLAYFLSPLWLILPAFVGLGLAFADITDTCGMALLLARMPWNQACQNST